MMLDLRIKVAVAAVALTMALPALATAKSTATDPKTVSRSSESAKTGSAGSTARSNDADRIVDPEQFDAALMERLVFEQSNKARRERDRRDLKPSAVLTRAARGHSRDMAERGYFSHTSGSFMNRQGLMERVMAAGGRRVACAENIAMVPVSKQMTGRWVEDTDGRTRLKWESHNRSYAQLAAETVQMWLDSPGHRKNLLRTEMSRLGIGCWIGEKRGAPYIYSTQDFSVE